MQIRPLGPLVHDQFCIFIQCLYNLDCPKLLRAMESPFECGMVVKGVCLSTSDTFDHLGFSYTVSQSQFSGENNTLLRSEENGQIADRKATAT